MCDLFININTTNCTLKYFRIALNALSSIFVSSTGLNIGDISNQNPTYITPDGVTFSVWGVIYTLEFFYTVYQALPSHIDEKEISMTRPTAIFAFLLNGVWLFLFTRAYWQETYIINIFILIIYIYIYKYNVCIYINRWLQWADIALYLVALAFLYRDLKIDYLNSQKSWQYQLCIYGGFSCNLAWATVATAVSTTTTFRNQGWVTPSLDGERPIGVNADWVYYIYICKY